MISTMLNSVATNPQRLVFQLPARTQGTNVHPAGGLIPGLCLWGTRLNRVLRNPERDGGRRLVEPNGPHYRNLPRAVQHPVVEAFAPTGSTYRRVRWPAAMAAQVGVDLLLGVLAAVQILGLMARGRSREASRIMVNHGTQLNLLAASGMSVAIFTGLVIGLGIL